jgi:hypothetical protein
MSTAMHGGAKRWQSTTSRWCPECGCEEHSGRVHREPNEARAYARELQAQGRVDEAQDWVRLADALDSIGADAARKSGLYLSTVEVEDVVRR